MKLIDIQKNKVVISPEALTIKEFKYIWDADNSKDKVFSVEDLSYVGFFCNRKSPYRNYDIDIREGKIISDIITRKNWKPDATIKAACEKFRDLTKTASSGLLEDAEYGLYKFRKYLKDTADKLADDEEGKIANMYLKNIKEIEAQLKVIDGLKERVDKESQDQGRIWGGGKLGNREIPKR